MESQIGGAADCRSRGGGRGGEGGLFFDAFDAFEHALDGLDAFRKVEV